MLCWKRIDEGLPEAGEAEKLYLRSFPEHERRPFAELLEGWGGKIELLAFYEQERFCGFAFLLTSLAITHIIYLAVEEPLRNQGVGSRMLEAVRAYRPGHRIIVDIERQTPVAVNNEQRRLRKEFYLRNGYAETRVRYRWNREEYEILSQGGDLSEAEFDAFWDSID
ncbi:MAG: GNAT family N-acetyltransferase [Oscillospiraceae bacterium]|nr:GNAT family N-acetyltransferase [Oscillospiraceae bacterium]